MKKITARRFFANCAKVGSEGYTGSLMAEDVLDCKDYPELNDYVGIAHNDSVLCKATCLFTCTLKDITGKPWIVHDTYFTEIPEMVKKFLIAHEIGHIVNGDLERGEKEIKKFNNERYSKKGSELEFKADEYAAKIIGHKNVLKCLKFLKKNTSFLVMSRRDTNNRIKHIKGLV